MRYEAITLLASLSLAAASPIGKIGYRPPRMLRGREVPQEHSHEQFITTVRASLNLNNPDKIEDPIFGLLGNAAASAGQGSISNTDCLHQATADQAFSNAKAAGDVDGMTAALIYAALERNTGSVGLASVLCTAITATNPEIAAISQHQVQKLHRHIKNFADHVIGPCFRWCSCNQQGHHLSIGRTDCIHRRRPPACIQIRNFCPRQSMFYLCCPQLLG
jgi:hypothetical protein